ncbi:hypothetical protein GBAR_LOCUS10655 [Geodia barretti]|uniref:Uncharacterized protein n=1 Tax=Geodia barretti TaxID=519541 RepID=A0AA35WHM2_GEOBA|nr:hypothetical protein GBAR_LOCUS10655 [Geodia barretti]
MERNPAYQVKEIKCQPTRPLPPSFPPPPTLHMLDST